MATPLYFCPSVGSKLCTPAEFLPLSRLIILASISPQDSHKESVSRYQQQIKEARKVIEELEVTSGMQIAEAKQQMHTTLEQKDGELGELRTAVTDLKAENQSITERLAEMEKKGKNGSEGFGVREMIREWEN